MDKEYIEWFTESVQCGDNVSEEYYVCVYNKDGHEIVTQGKTLSIALERLSDTIAIEVEGAEITWK